MHAFLGNVHCTVCGQDIEVLPEFQEEMTVEGFMDAINKATEPHKAICIGTQIDGEELLDR